MRFGLATRLTLVLALILASGVIMTTALSVHMFERTLADVLSSRFEFVLKDIRQRLETQMDLGLGLPVLQGVSEDLEKRLRADEHLLSIEVFDETGIVLFSTDPSFVGDLVADEWLLAWRTTRADEKAWSDQKRDARVVGVPLRDNLGRDVGAIALRYSWDFLNNSIISQVSRLLTIGAVVVLGMAPLSIFGAIFLLRPLSEDLRNLRESVEDVANRRWDGEALGKRDAMDPDFAAFAAAALGAHHTIDEAISEIRRLDEEEAV